MASRAASGRISAPPGDDLATARRLRSASSAESTRPRTVIPGAGSMRNGPSPATASGRSAARAAAMASRTPFSSAEAGPGQTPGPRRRIAPRSPAGRTRGRSRGPRRRRTELPQAGQRERRARRTRPRRTPAASATTPAPRRRRPTPRATRWPVRTLGSVLRPWRVQSSTGRRTAFFWAGGGCAGAARPRARRTAPPPVRQPKAGLTLCACTTRAPVARAAATASSSAPPRWQRPGGARGRQRGRVAREHLDRPHRARSGSASRSATARSSPRARDTGCAAAGSRPARTYGRSCADLHHHPSRAAPWHLDVALGRRRQAAAHDAEVIVVHDDVVDPPRGTSPRATARFTSHTARRAASTSRATPASTRRGATCCALLDDDVEVWDGWLDALTGAADDNPDHEALGGPIRPRLERRLPACGREPLPITRARPRDHRPRRRAAVGREPRRPARRRSSASAPSNARPQQLVATEEWEDRLAAAGVRPLRRGRRPTPQRAGREAAPPRHGRPRPWPGRPPVRPPPRDRARPRRRGPRPHAAASGTCSAAAAPTGS